MFHITKRATAAILSAALVLSLMLAACNKDSGGGSSITASETPNTTNPTATTQIETPQQTSGNQGNTIQDFIDALSDSDIAAAKKAAEQYLQDSPNGVLSITFDSEVRGSGENWRIYGVGDDLNPDAPRFTPGNLIVFNVKTERYGDSDSITLGRKDANSTWDVLNYGR